MTIQGQRYRISQIVCLILYYTIARWLPATNEYNFPFARKFRYLCCKYLFKKIGKNVNIERGAWFGKGQDIEIGDNSGIGVNAHILNNTIIGKDVMIGPNLYMMESTHLFDRIDIPMMYQGRKKNRDQVIIGDDVWIGQDVMIVGSREIKTGSIVGARCVLTKSFPEYSIIGGNPSKLIRSRL